jgi:hypothetical protein
VLWGVYVDGGVLRVGRGGRVVVLDRLVYVEVCVIRYV